MTIVYLEDINDLEISQEGVMHLDPDTTYVFVKPMEIIINIPKIPIHHGPIRSRGKGKVNRDWEK